MENIGFSEIVSNIDLQELHWVAKIALLAGLFAVASGLSLLISKDGKEGGGNLIIGIIVLIIFFYFRYERSRDQLIVKANHERELTEKQEKKASLEQIQKEQDNCNIEMARHKAEEFLRRKQLPIIELISSQFLDNSRCEVAYIFRVKKMVYNGYSYVQGDKMYQATLTLGKFSGNYEFIDGDLYDPIEKTVQQILK